MTDRPPLSVRVGRLEILVDRYELPSGAAGWRVARDAVVEIDGEQVAVAIDIRMIEKRAQPLLAWPTSDHRELLASVETAKIVRAEFNKGGTTIAFRIELSTGGRVLFRPDQINPHTSPRKEVAAYRVARMIGSNAVPPATFKRVHRDDLLGRLAPDATCLLPRILAESRFDEQGLTVGAASIWVPSLVDSRLDTLHSMIGWAPWLSNEAEIPEGRGELMAQLSSLLLFDVVINNEDRFTGGNLPVSPDDRTLYWIDNGFSFAPNPQAHPRCWAALQRCQRFSRATVEALRALSPAPLVEEGLLDLDEAAALLGRGALVLEHIDRLISQRGEAAVFAFP